jgi:EmrB/QacA subfamily drug resistance transporter
MEESARTATTNLKTVFAGLMMGMFLAAVNQTIIAPAMPRIVAELGGMKHYSWIAVSALLASTVIVPVVGKLSDLYGRKAFYVGGILVFMASSLVAGLSSNFGMFMVARILEGLGMGTMMPLSQAIIGDLIPPRDRGRYQGLMGSVFGLASIIGPFLGGAITDHLSWRWLFFVNIPSALVALAVIVPFMKLPHTPQRHRIDYAGFVTLSVGLTSTLLAAVWGGTEFPWRSAPILGLFALGAVSLGLFIWVETRAAEPVMPLRLWRNGIFTSANLAIMGVAMAMFGGIYFIPMFVQGVLGVSVMGSGAVLTPMMLTMVVTSTLTGLLISRTGRYKIPVVLGVSLLAFGLFLLTRMDRGTSYGEVMRNLVAIGAGLGLAMQTFVLVVQNAVGREDMGIATATTQLSRSIGASVGIAILGAILAQRMASEVPRLLPAGAAAGASLGGGGEASAGAVLDPKLLAGLPPPVLAAVREALAVSLHSVFVCALAFSGLALVSALFLREIPLRRTVQGAPREAGREILAEMGQASQEDGGQVLGTPNPAYRARVSFLGLAFGLLACESGRPGRPRLSELMTHIGEGDADRGRERLEALACALLDECGGREASAGRTTPQALCAALELRARRDLDALDPEAEFQRALADNPPALQAKLRSLVTSGKDPAALLNPGDVEALERVGIVVSAALLLDAASPREPGPEEGPAPRERATAAAAGG